MTFMVRSLAIDRPPCAGAARSIFSEDSWWKTGLEMLTLGVLVAVVAYAAGAIAGAPAASIA